MAAAELELMAFKRRTDATLEEHDKRINDMATHNIALHQKMVDDVTKFVDEKKSEIQRETLNYVIQFIGIFAVVITVLVAFPTFATVVSHYSDYDMIKWGGMTMLLLLGLIVVLLVLNLTTKRKIRGDSK